MIKNLFKLTIIAMFATSFAHAEDPFSRSFSAPSSLAPSSSDISMGSSNSDDSIHPMVRYDVTKYFVKGVISSQEGALAVVSLPGDKDYFLFLGDPLGNDLHTIRDINQDFIVLSKSNGEDVSITVSNPIRGGSQGGMQ
jgi:Tfp pilus assembly protein PilP